jgi:hypothetical protein
VLKKWKWRGHVEEKLGIPEHPRSENSSGGPYILESIGKTISASSFDHNCIQIPPRSSRIIPQCALIKMTLL